MPFIFDVMTVSAVGNEQHLRGRVSSGAYFGPEEVIAHSTDGRISHSCILSHAIEHPQGWPVLPQHAGTVVTLTIRAIEQDFAIAQLEGVGAVASSARRTDISYLMREPEFWACQLTLRFNSESIDDPGMDWLGISAEISSAWYVRHIESLLDAHCWPFIRVSLPDSRYIEMEMAGGAEYQDRVWVGDDSNRVLLGYHSGHFSLPAMRWEEASQIAALTSHNVSNLLWLSTVYLSSAQAGTARKLIERLVSAIPNCRADKASEMAEVFLENRTVEDVAWAHDGERGWINNSLYSQRNPDSLLSVLSRADFAFVREFFSAAGDHVA